ncbi:MAG TPA: GntR family transcriptional regulator [Ruminococcaceae bacterium]|jgi:K+/H+ antiporter YhaU regulatory subunit KhtT|nr:GntR family transcriptional regulator [Oscillospiraceae bacterium]
MNEKITPPVYAQIALDVANRIARGDLKENTKLHGRSVLSSEYGVSPETIRRALRLLEDMHIVQVKQNSGTIVKSAEHARIYVEKFNEQNDVRALYRKLKSLIAQQREINNHIFEIANLIVRTSDKFSKSNPFQNFEIDIPDESPIVGKNFQELKFWQETGATIIAIRRDDSIILSPGPYVVINSGDTLIFVGDISTIERVNDLVLGR